LVFVFPFVNRLICIAFLSSSNSLVNKIRDYYARVGLSVPFCTYSLYRRIPIFKCLVDANW
jgi:hypothetical protein